MRRCRLQAVDSQRERGEGELQGWTPRPLILGPAIAATYGRMDHRQSRRGAGPAVARPLPLIQYCFRTYGSEGVCLGWLDLTALNALSSASQEW